MLPRLQGACPTCFSLFRQPAISAVPPLSPPAHTLYFFPSRHTSLPVYQPIDLRPSIIFSPSFSSFLLPFICPSIYPSICFLHNSSQCLFRALLNMSEAIRPTTLLRQQNELTPPIGTHLRNKTSINKHLVFYQCTQIPLCTHSLSLSTLIHCLATQPWSYCNSRLVCSF